MIGRNYCAINTEATVIVKASELRVGHSSVLLLVFVVGGGTFEVVGLVDAVEVVARFLDVLSVGEFVLSAGSAGILTSSCG